MCAENENMNDCSRKNEISRVHINELELMGCVPNGAMTTIRKEEMKLNKQLGETGFGALETEGNPVGLQRVVSKESLCLENNKAGEQDNGPNKEYGPQLDTDVESGGRAYRTKEKQKRISRNKINK
ncbi:hypothetical protein V6N13_092872 [Hibiscus sabdariffa]